MAWAEQLPNGTWRGFWRDADGRRRSKSGFASEKKAEDHATWVEQKIKRGEKVDSGRAPTWGAWSQAWQARRVVEPSTARQDAVRIDRYLTPYWGGQRINKIKRGDVQAWVNELAVTARHDGTSQRDPQPLSPSTVARIFHLFSASMKAAVLDETVPLLASPCLGVKLPGAAPGHERFLTRVEFDLIADCLNQPYRFAAQLLVGTGMRFGEAAGLHWQRVDLAAGLIDVVETWDPAAGRIKAYPKGHYRRAVPIPDWLLPALQARLELATDARDCGLPHASGARCRSGLVITGRNGAPLDAHNLGRRQWASAVEQAGIDHCRLHDLRHTYASWLVQDGVSLQEVQRLLGHAAITTTQRYAHLGTSQHERVLRALNTGR